MKKKRKEQEPSAVIVIIVTVIIILSWKGCTAYCVKHHDEWEQENREQSERNMQEAYYNCKFEHDQ